MKNDLTAAHISATIADLEGKLEHAQAWAAQCQAELDTALLEHLNGTIDAGAVKKARQAADAARQGVSDTQGALSAARALLADAEANDRRQADAVRWRRVIDLAAQRGALAKRIEAQAEALGKDYMSLLVVSREIAETAPRRIDEGASMIGDPTIAVAVRETLQLHGVLAGMPSLPWSNWELRQRPSLSERIEGGATYLKGRHHG